MVESLLLVAGSLNEVRETRGRMMSPYRRQVSRWIGLNRLTTRSLCVVALSFTVLNICPGILPESEAKDLTVVLQQGLTLDFPAFRLNTRDFASHISPAFASAIAQAVTYQLPLVSLAPAFAPRYDPSLHLYEQVLEVPGPLFSERALTLGKGRLNFSVGYSYVDFSELNGTSLHDLASPALFLDPSPKEAVSTGGGGFFLAPAVLSKLHTRLDLNAHIVAPTFRYGITRKWEVGLTIPVLNTFLRIRETSVPAVVVDPNSRIGYAYNRGPGGQFFGEGLASLTSSGFFKFTCAKAQEALVQCLGKQLFVKSRASTRSLGKATGSATGVGDIILRSKYHFWRTATGGAALGMSLQLPSGEKRNFQGTGETHVRPALYLSQIFVERIEPHLNLGVDFNANDIERSSFFYATGVSTLLWRQLGLIIDVIGQSEFKRAILPGTQMQPSLPGLVIDRGPGTCTLESPCRAAATVPVFVLREKIKRNDIVDLTFGLRYALGHSGSVFFGGIIPLNADGFRADFIPSTGVEYTFY